ncbi:MAG TPA: hypothetical protein VJ772_01845 [Nitrososphaeraceae archaeon]|nr:hypothetical protein [Nitrososphaeraceae archaeon]
MSKYTYSERQDVKSLVATLTIKRIPESEIRQEIYRQTGKTLSRSGLFNVKQAIKKESYYWYQRLREGNYEYIHEFSSRVKEIEDLMKRHYEIIDNNKDNPTVQQRSLEEIHKLSITLSNLYDVAPSIVGYSKQNKDFTGKINGDTLPISQQEIIV